MFGTLPSSLLLLLLLPFGRMDEHWYTLGNALFASREKVSFVAVEFGFKVIKV